MLPSASAATLANDNTLGKAAIQAVNQQYKKSESSATKHRQ